MQAEALITLGRNGEAIDKLDALLRLAPEDSHAYSDRGLARWRSLPAMPAPSTSDSGFAFLQGESCREGRTECEPVTLALADLGRAVDFLSGVERAVPLVIRARIYATRGDLRQALADYDAAVAAAPEGETALVDCADIRYRSGDVSGARTDLDESIRLDPQDGQALLQRARLHQQAGDLAGARADLDTALHTAPKRDAPPWFGEAVALRRAVAALGEPGMETELSNLRIIDVTQVHDATGGDAVSIRLDADAKQRFAMFTASHIGSVVEIRIGEAVVAQPRIMAAITGGSLIIPGAFTVQQAADLASQCKTAANMAVRAME